MLAYFTGSVSEDLLRRIEYLLEDRTVPVGDHPYHSPPTFQR